MQVTRKMNHLNEEQLILHYYGEEGDDSSTAEQHLEECGECRALYASLQRVLNVVDSLPVPERGAEYGAQVWQRIESASAGAAAVRLAGRVPAPMRWAAAGAAFAGLLVAAFLAGRFYPGRAASAGADGRGRSADSQRPSASCWWRWAITWSARRWC